MTTILFLAFVALMTAIVVALISRYRNTRAAVGVLAGLLLWFAYACLMAYFGGPPGIAFIILPVTAFLLFFIWRACSRASIALPFPLWIILSTQSFRIGVELFLHQLWIDGLVPKMLTFKGANVDIFIGASAPVIAWLSTRGRLGLKLALIWNVLGLLALANVVTRSVLTAPGPLHRIHAEVPNLMMSTFPFLLIPAFFVPLAVVLHVLAIQNIRRGLTPPADRS
jgi:hypothetical protein